MPPFCGTEKLANSSSLLSRRAILIAIITVGDRPLSHVSDLSIQSSQNALNKLCYYSIVGQLLNCRRSHLGGELHRLDFSEGSLDSPIFSLGHKNCFKTPTTHLRIFLNFPSRFKSSTCTLLFVDRKNRSCTTWYRFIFTFTLCSLTVLSSCSLY